MKKIRCSGCKKIISPKTIILIIDEAMIGNNEEEKTTYNPLKRAMYCSDCRKKLYGFFGVLYGLGGKNAK